MRTYIEPDAVEYLDEICPRPVRPSRPLTAFWAHLHGVPVGFGSVANKTYQKAFW